MGKEHSALSSHGRPRYVPSVISVAKSVRYVGVGVLPARVLVQIEVPRGSFLKRRLDGQIEFISPIPCPFNYGSIVAIPGLDGEPLDALVLGPGLPFGAQCEVPVRAVMGFVDAGIEDPKVVCSHAPLHTAQKQVVERFFRFYAHVKRTAYRVRRRMPGLTQMQGWLPLEVLGEDGG